jgi:TolB protein
MKKQVSEERVNIMNDSRLKRMWLVGWLITVILVIACGTSKKTIKETSLSAPETNLTFLLQELKENPKNPSVFVKLSNVYEKLDSLDYALAMIDSALSLDPKLNTAKMARAGLLLKKNQIREGYTEFLEVLNSETGEEFINDIRYQLGKPFPIHKLTTGNDNNAFPHFSPNGKRIAFQSDRDGNWEIYLMDADGAQEVRITQNNVQDEMPVFSRENNLLVFTSTREDTINRARLDKKRDIFMMNLETGAVDNLSRHEADDWYPSLSENGNDLVFSSERDDQRDVPFHEKLSEIYIQNLKNSEVLRLTQNESDDGSPSCSADGKWIVFTSNRNASYEVFRMSLKGQSTEQITDLKANCGSPHYSHDGKKITFFADLKGNFDIYMMDSNGENLIQLTNDPLQDSYPSFSTDKRKIIFHSNQTGKFQIYWIDLMNPLSQDELIRNLEEKIALLNK